MTTHLDRCLHLDSTTRDYEIVTLRRRRLEAKLCQTRFLISTDIIAGYQRTRTPQYYCPASYFVYPARPSKSAAVSAECRQDDIQNKAREARKHSGVNERATYVKLYTGRSGWNRHLPVSGACSGLDIYPHRCAAQCAISHVNVHVPRVLRVASDSTAALYQTLQMS